MAKVIVDKHLGFCPGVKTSIDSALKIARSEETENTVVVTYGDLIHNPIVTEELKCSGVGVINTLGEAQARHTVIIRAHGVPPSDEEFLKKHHIPYKDLTCGIVKSLHKKIVHFRDKGYRILILGSPKHPESIGHLGYAGEGGLILSSIEEAESLLPGEKDFLIAQTTVSTELFEAVESCLKRKNPALQSLNSICPHVIRRQEWIIKWSAICDASLIVGGRKSSNTRKLFELASARGPAFYIENPEELDTEALASYNRIALSSGTSTPEKTVEEVLARLKDKGFGIEFQ